MTEKLLPLGTIVYLKEGTAKLIGTWNIGSQLTEDISKMPPKFPKVLEIKFGG